jgi:hypothetical protein
MLAEPAIADGVAFVIGMLAAIDLDDDSFLPTGEIYHIRPDRLLAHEFESGERSRTKILPKLTFSSRRIFPQLPS